MHLLGAIFFIVITMIPTVHGATQENTLQHDWKQERENGEVRFISNYPAPFPFSTTGEPEAIMTINVEKISPDKKALAEIMQSEVEAIRKEIQITDYLEEDGQTPDHGIATYVEEINGQQVGFIKYRTTGLIGRPAVMPRTVIHAIVMKNDRIYFVHLIVLFSEHQEEIRADQITMIKGLIGR
jgi:hypothetical protein